MNKHHSLHWTAAALVIVAAATGCRSHQKVAATPVAVPAAAASAQAPHFQRVEPPSKDFVTPRPTEDIGNDPIQVTNLADQKGWLRDAFFDFDSSALTKLAQDNLSDSAHWLRDHRKFNVLIEGHCDERGTEQYNLALGDHRAWGAKEYLTTLGIDTKKVGTISYGKDRPFATGHDEQSWAQNRRAHIVLTQTATQSASQ